MSRKKTSRSSMARRGTVRLGWRKRALKAFLFEQERKRRLQEMVL